MALPLAISACFTSCKDDTQPRLENPTEFVLNTPSMADQTYIFRDDENYKNLNDITFTVSQPNYGIGVTPTYYVQLAKNEADFVDWDRAMEEAAVNGETLDANKVLDASGLPLAYALNFSTQQAIITLDGVTFCDGVNALYGLDADNYSGETLDVAVRVHASLPNAPQSEIWSNVVTIKVSSYIPVKAPGKLYLIGAPQGDWDINNGYDELNETGIGTKVYYGNIFIPEGKFLFRFYSQLGDWESWSVGAQDEDNPVDISFNDEGVYEGKVYMGVEQGDKKGKGSWQDTSWSGGNVEITIDLKEMTIVMKKAPAKKVYIIGDCSGWDINNDAMYLEETPAGSNIFKGSYNVEAGKFMLRIYTVLGDWGKGSIGAEGEGNPEIALPFNGPAVVDSQANWTISGWAGGMVDFTFDMNSYTLEMQAQ